MTSIAHKTCAEQSTVKSVSRFMKRYKIGAALKSAGAYKSKGISVYIIVQYLIALIYTGKSMYQDMRSEKPFAQGFTKNVVYNFMNQMTVNWRRFLLMVASSVVAEIDRLTSEARRAAFVIDDTMFQLLHAKKTELVSLIHDHAEKGKNKFKWGFRLLTLGWTDGATFIPLAFRHLASSDEKKQRCGVKPGIDKRSRAYSIRKEAISKATDVLLIQLKAAIKAGIAAKYVLFDSWFAYPVTIAKIHALGLHVVARVKDTKTIKYLVNGEKKTLREIYRGSKKRRGKSRYLLSVPVTVYSELEGKAVEVQARLVYVRNRNKRSDWIAIISTDMDLTEEEIIAQYGKRWEIEVFFKICKSYLKLAKEFQQLSYDAITAHTTMVMLRYMMLSVEKRTMEDPRTLGELFFLCCDEAGDVKFEQALAYLIALLSEVLKDEGLGLTEEQMERIMDAFIAKLPYEFRLCLQPELAA